MRPAHFFSPAPLALRLSRAVSSASLAPVACPGQHSTSQRFTHRSAHQATHRSARQAWTVAASAVFLFAGVMMISTTASAQCNPAILQGAQQRQQIDVQAAAQHAQDVYRSSQTQPDWMSNSDGMLTACAANNWPKIPISNPILSQLMDGAEQQAVKAACNKARNVVSQGSNAVQSTLHSIPGYGQMQTVVNGVNNGQMGSLANGAGAGIANWATSGSDPLGGLPSSGQGGMGGYQSQPWTSLPGVGQMPVSQAPSPVSDPQSPGLPGVSVQ